MNRKFIRAIAIFMTLTCPLLTSCVGSLTNPGTVRTDIHNSTLSKYNGPKARLSVATVGWQSGQVDQIEDYPSMDMDMHSDASMPSMDALLPNHTHTRYSDGLTEQLTRALLTTNHFRILENDQLAELRTLQRQSNAGANSTQAGVDLLVVATITDWDPGNSGTEGQLSGLTSKGLSNLIDAVKGGVSRSGMTMQVRLIDVQSREILNATEVRTSANNINLSTTLQGVASQTGLSGELSTFANTSMEKAIRAAVFDAADFIASNTPASYLKY